MKKNIEVNKYAKALYEVSHQTNSIENTQNYLEVISFFYASSSEFRFFLQSKRIQSTKKKEIIDKTLSKVVSSLELDLLCYLIDSDHINLLQLIIKQFNLICSQQNKTTQVVLTTVNKMSLEEKNEVVKSIENALNKKIILNNQLDPNMIGGIKLRIGNMIIDGSISQRLEKLKQSLYGR